VTQMLYRYISRYCDEYGIAFNRESENEKNSEFNIPVRINDILFAFIVGIKKIEEKEYFYIQVPVMEIPVGKVLLPLYRKILEINYYLRMVSFSLQDTTIFLSYFQPLGSKTFPGSFRYSDFKDSMNRVYSALNKYSEYLYYEFGEMDG